MEPPLRFGLVGAGSVALRGILPHLTQPDIAHRGRITALCDPAPGRAQAAAERFGVPHHYTDYEQLLSDDTVDAVIIASPIGLHYEQGLAAVLSGRHVYFSKTMTTTTDEADRLIAAADAAQVHLVASPGEMLRPHNQEIRKLLASGAIGDLCWAACGAAFGTYHENEEFRTGDDPLTNIDPSWYYRKPGGGPLYDMTVYALHALTGVLGPVQQVTALSGIRLPTREHKGAVVTVEADDQTAMLLDFGGGVFAFAYGTPAGEVTQGFLGSYFGTDGQIVGLDLNGRPFDYPGRELADTAPPDPLNRFGGAGTEWVLPHIDGVHRDIGEQHVYADIMELVDLVLDGKPTPATAEHARHVIEIIERAYEAAATGQRQRLRTTF